MKTGKVSWTLFGPNNDDWDILILVLPSPLEKPIVLFTSKEEYKKNTNVYGSMFTLVANLKGIPGWYTSPFSVLPKPLSSIRQKNLKQSI